MVDLTVAAVPFYFGSMEAERRYLGRRAEAEGGLRGDFTKSDTIASLTMGVGSLVLPLLTHRVAKHLAIGEGRHARKLIALAAGAAVITTVADRVVAADEAIPAEPAAVDRDEATNRVNGSPSGSRSGATSTRGRLARLARWARRVRRVSGPTAIGAAVVSLGATTTTKTTPQRMWRGSKRDLGTGPLAWTVAVVGWDFIYYWNHRMMHESRLLWAHHVVHHSSERYNLSTALRQPVADVLAVFIPTGLLARLGVRPSLIEHARGINLLYQYWIHTETIPKLGRAEDVLNTPSHHRVHHGSNRQYLDRNHGSILITWDRLFGTFEREDEPVVYGLTKNINTYRPHRIISHEHADIVRDVSRSATWRERLSFVVRGPGWAYRRHEELAGEDTLAA